MENLEIAQKYSRVLGLIAHHDEIMDAFNDYVNSLDIENKTPTALEIIEQMPPMTSISKNYFGVWECSFALAMYQTDYRADPCPHKAAALAFIAWKKGME